MHKRKSSLSGRSSSFAHRVHRVLVPLWRITVFFIVGVLLAALLYWVGGRELHLWISAKRWIKTECTIQDASVGSQTHNTEDGLEERYRVETNYWFLDETDTVRGNRYDFSGDGYSPGYSAKSSAVKKLKRSPTVHCYYDSQNPARSVIDRSFHPFMLFATIPLVLLLLYVFRLRHYFVTYLLIE